MGVFLYSNKKIVTSKIIDVFKTRGHKDIIDRSENGYTLVTAPKIIVKNTNFLSGEELGGLSTDFAIGIGTYFYKSSYGVEALKKVYEELEAVLNDNPVYGHWAFCIKKDDIVYIFNDMSGFMRLYYHEDGEQIVVSSSDLAIVSTLQNPRFDKVKLAGFLTTAYGREIPVVKGVENINPYKYLVVKNGQAPLWVEKSIPEVKRLETLKEAVPFVINLFKEQMSVIKPAIGDKKVYTNATGGLDSRLLACILRSSGINFEYLNYPIYGPDTEIAQILAEGIGKKLHLQTNIPFGNDFKNHYGEYDFGHNFFRQYPNPRWKLEFEFEFSGARGECIDLPDIYSDEDLSYMVNPTPDSLLSHLMMNPQLDKVINCQYINYLEIFMGERGGFKKGELLTEQQQSEFGQMLGGQFGDSMYNSAAQAHEYFYQIYNEWHFNHFIHNIAFDAKKGRKLTLALISNIDPELGSYPFVSRLNTRRNSVNEIHELPLKYSVYGSLKKYVPIFIKNFLYNHVAVRKSNIDEDILNQIDFDLYKDIIKTNHVKRNRNLYHDTIKRLYTIDVIRSQMGIELP